MKIKNKIPNLITLLNLICGSLAVIFALKSNISISIFLILLAAIFDFMDGFAARLLKAYSDIGKELDSLADVISFGLAPSIILYQIYSGILPNNIPASAPEWLSILAYIPLLIVAGSALRLAKFNIDTRQTEKFLGLPTPANALLICAIADLIQRLDPASLFMAIFDNIYVIPVLSILLTYLLVCEIPMFSLKMKSLKWSDNKIHINFLIISILLAIVTLLIRLPFSLWMAEILLLYIIINITIYLRATLKSQEKINE